MPSRPQHLRICIAILIVLGLPGPPAVAQEGQQPASPEAEPVPSEPGTLTTEQRVTLLEERLNLALALKDERLQGVVGRVDNLYSMMQLVLVFVSIIVIALSIRDYFHYKREGERQRDIDDIVKDTMTLQNSSLRQQVSLGALQLEDVTKSRADRTGPVRDVRDVIEVVQQTLEFRLEQDKKVAIAIEEIERIKQERERIRQRKIEDAASVLDQFAVMSRMQFASLSEEQQKRGIKLQTLVAELDESLHDTPFQLAGGLLYTSGVIAYYDNNVIEALAFLNRAAECRAEDHEAELTTNADYRQRFAFIHYFRAIFPRP